MKVKLPSELRMQCPRCGEPQEDVDVNGSEVELRCGHTLSQADLRQMYEL